MTDTDPDPAEDHRLRVLRATQLLDSPPEASFDRLTSLAARTLRAPIALVSLVDAQRQFFKSARGLDEPWASSRQTPLTHSLCKVPVAERKPLIIGDARAHEELRDHPAIRELGVVAYLGVPLIVDDAAVGALCVIDRTARTWTEDDVTTLVDLAAIAASEIAARKSTLMGRQVHQAIVRQLPSGAVFMVDHDLRYVDADGPMVEATLRARGWTTLAGRSVDEAVPEVDRKEVVALYREALAGRAQRAEIRRDGRFFEAYAGPIFDGQERVTHAVAFLYDVTLRKREAETLARIGDAFAGERALLDATLEKIEDGVLLSDESHKIVLVNSSLVGMFGLPKDQLEGMSRDEFLGHLAALVDQPLAFLATVSAHDGMVRDCEFVRPRRRVLRRTEASVKLPEGEHFLMTWHDVTSEKDLIAERERQMMTDVLTGLPNRRGAEAALRLEDARRKRSGSPLSVAILDVDHFKQVNDTYGHAAGDEVLRRIAATLASQARLTDHVARWGGEEFLAILPGPLDGARVFCERVRGAVAKLDCPGGTSVTLSAGVAVVGSAEAPIDAIGRADERLYEAKRAGRNRVA